MFAKMKSLNTLMNFDWVYRRSRRRLDMDLRVLDPPCFGLLEADAPGAAADAGAADRFLDEAGATADAPGAAADAPSATAAAPGAAADALGRSARNDSLNSN